MSSPSAAQTSDLHVARAQKERRIQIKKRAAGNISVIDGVFAALHADPGRGPGAAAVAARFPKRPPGVTACDVEELAAASLPGPLFASPALIVKDSYVQLSPCDERCEAGEVTIKPDAIGPFPQISGEIFALRRVTA
jgi:hypothetical protein